MQNNANNNDDKDNDDENDYYNDDNDNDECTINFLKANNDVDTEFMPADSVHNAAPTKRH